MIAGGSCKREWARFHFPHVEAETGNGKQRKSRWQKWGGGNAVERNRAGARTTKLCPSSQGSALSQRDAGCLQPRVVCCWQSRGAH